MNLKKVIALLLVFVLCFSFSACGKTSNYIMLKNVEKAIINTEWRYWPNHNFDDENNFSIIRFHPDGVVDEYTVTRKYEYSDFNFNSTRGYYEILTKENIIICYFDNYRRTFFFSCYGNNIINISEKDDKNTIIQHLEKDKWLLYLSTTNRR